MATTTAKTAWDNALRYAKNYGPNADHRFLAMNAANQRFHLAAPWRWSLGSLSETNLADNTQDYTITSPPTDYLFLHQVQKWSGGQMLTPMQVVGTLPATTNVAASPTRVTVFNDGALKYRVWPKPTGQGTNPSVLIGEYKRSTTLITSGNESTASILLFPDDYYYIYELFVLHYVLKYSHDQRAGMAQIGPSGVAYTGVLAEAIAAVAEIQQREMQSYTSDGVVVR